MSFFKALGGCIDKTFIYLWGLLGLKFVRDRQMPTEQREVGIWRSLYLSDTGLRGTPQSGIDRVTAVIQGYRSNHSLVRLCDESGRPRPAARRSSTVEPQAGPLRRRER